MEISSNQANHTGVTLSTSSSSSSTSLSAVDTAVVNQARTVAQLATQSVGIQASSSTAVLKGFRIAETTLLRSGRATCIMEPSHFEKVPKKIQEKICTK